MNHSSPIKTFPAWLDEHVIQGKRNIPARLLTLLGFLERLRETPSLELNAHLAPSHTQLIEHNGFVDAALSRFGVDSPVQEKGRRANNLNAWMPPLFDWLRDNEFPSLTDEPRSEFLTALQSLASARLVEINEDKPLIARYNKGTTVAIVADLLDQAQVKKRAKDVAEYLVGAKLEIKFGNGIVTPKHVNAPSRGHLADFRIGDTAIEVTTVERPDKSHLDQVAEILNNTGLHVWLLTRLKDREKWQIVVQSLFESQAGRIAVTDIETFVGQNVAEIGIFGIAACKNTLAKLFSRYEEAWLPKFGAGGLRIVDHEATKEE